MHITHNSSADAGATYEEEHEVLLYASYFFMTGDVYSHEYTAYNIINLFS